MAINEKSLAVESMHRLSKHINDSLREPEKGLNDEVMEIHQVWDLRDIMPGPDLNGCLQHLRSYVKPDGALDWQRLSRDNQGWKPKGRRGLTTG